MTMPPYNYPGVYVQEVSSAFRPIVGVGTSTAAFIGIAGVASPGRERSGSGGKAAGDEAPPQKLFQVVNSWTEFTQKFGDIQKENQYLAHAVYGFFNNLGTRCWVAGLKVDSENKYPNLAKDLTAALTELAANDEVSIVAAPLPPDVPATALPEVYSQLREHCTRMEDRVAILDCPPNAKPDLDGVGKPAADDKGYAAFYFPWIRVADPLEEAGALIPVPPSGHLAGVYARNDAERGVFKAPANEIIRGALDLEYQVSKFQQGALNLDGVNCIRSFSGTIKVYGARTLASSTKANTGNEEWQYVSVRRLVNYLRRSIDVGMQWVVFEPNAEDLWSKIRRNVGGFLNGEWAAGALVGATPEQAFYVICDETTNPPEIRAHGQVVTEIGVAVVRPAEFVIFRITQWAGAAEGQ
jgi:uncharacterized protein